jgi:hypothetical protein
MKKLLLAAVALSAFAVPAHAQTMPPASITAASASRDDLNTLKTIIEKNSVEHQALIDKVNETSSTLAQVNQDLTNLKKALAVGVLKIPTWRMSHDQLVVYITDTTVRNAIATGKGNQPTPAQVHSYQGNAESIAQEWEAGETTGYGVNNLPQLQTALQTATNAHNNAVAAVAAFERKTAATVRLAEAVATNVNATEHRIAAEQAVKDAEADQIAATDEQAKAEATAKIEQQAADERAKAAAIRQKAADAAKAASDAMAKAKADEAAAAQKEHDAKIASEIAKAPAPAPKRVWWLLYTDAPRCITATEAGVPSPAEMVERMSAKLEDKGVYVHVTVTWAGETKDIAYYRTQDGCEKDKAAYIQAQQDKSHALDQYR